MGNTLGNILGNMYPGNGCSWSPTFHLKKQKKRPELAIVTLNSRPQQFDEAGLDKGNVIFSQVNTAIEQTSLGQVAKMVVW